LDEWEDTAAPQKPEESRMLERLYKEIMRRTPMVRIFPHEASCQCLSLTLAVEAHRETYRGDSASEQGRSEGEQTRAYEESRGTKREAHWQEHAQSASASAIW
jgi:transposase-like protein